MAALFIDGAYLSMGIREFEDPHQRAFLNFAKMGDDLVAPYSRLRTYYYNSPPIDEYAAERVEKFYAVLELSSRLEVKLGKMKGPYEDNPAHQKQVDVLLALDMYRLASTGKIDMAALLTGDGDFVPALHAVKDVGVLTKLVHIAESAVEPELKLVADEHLEIGEADFRRWKPKTAEQQPSGPQADYPQKG